VKDIATVSGVKASADGADCINGVGRCRLAGNRAGRRPWAQL